MWFTCVTSLMEDLKVSSGKYGGCSCVHENFLSACFDCVQACVCVCERVSVSVRERERARKHRLFSSSGIQRDSQFPVLSH